MLVVFTVKKTFAIDVPPSIKLLRNDQIPGIFVFDLTS